MRPRRIDPALTYFRAGHYHRPWLLDFRVRKGNGYFQPGMGTGRRLWDPGFRSDDTVQAPPSRGRGRASGSGAAGPDFFPACRRCWAGPTQPEPATPRSEDRSLGWWKETAEASSEDEIKPIDWLVPVG